MKKLLTLVLALVLVFAIAAPAMAITDTAEDPDETKYVDFVSLDLALLKAAVEPAFGGFAVSEIAANKAYIVNETLYYGIALNFPEFDENEEENMDEDDYEDAKLYLKATGVALNVPAKADTFQVESDGTFSPSTEFAGWTWIKNTTDGIHVDAFVDENLGTGHSLYAFGSGIVAKKGVVKVELIDKPTWPIEIYDGVDLAFEVKKGTDCSMAATRGDDYEVYMYDTDDGSTLAQVAFLHKTTSDKVAAIYVADPGVAWYKIGYGVSYSNGLQTKVAPKALIGADGTVYDITVTDPTKAGYLKDSADLFGYYEDVMAFFGFDAAKDGLLLDKHFEAKSSGLYLKDECAVQLYDAQIVVPGDVVPPKTGDAASIVGFAMIAVAMIAAGVVVSRKVRA